MTRRLNLLRKTAADARAMVSTMSIADRAHLSPEWLARIQSPSADDHLWTFGFTTLRAKDGIAVGQCGFKGPPDAKGVVEIAYSTIPPFEGCGYATEAVRSLVEIAFSHSSVSTVRAHTFSSTNASTHILEKIGFACLGEVTDPEDGQVWRWEIARETGQPL